MLGLQKNYAEGTGFLCLSPYSCHSGLFIATIVSHKFPYLEKLNMQLLVKVIC